VLDGEAGDLADLASDGASGLAGEASMAARVNVGVSGLVVWSSAAKVRRAE
jgi:hypothetical protein